MITLNELNSLLTFCIFIIVAAPTLVSLIFHHHQCL